ncbi:MAG: hypothetical protein ABFD89_16855 [Bryobacteraceae bacterium]
MTNSNDSHATQEHRTKVQEAVQQISTLDLSVDESLNGLVEVLERRRQAVADLIGVLGAPNELTNYLQRSLGPAILRAAEVCGLRQYANISIWPCNPASVPPLAEFDKGVLGRILESE